MSLAVMKITLRVALFMVYVCMVFVVVTIPAVIVTPVPAIVASIFASMPLAMAPLVFACMAIFTEIVAPIMISITRVVLDERLTSLRYET